MKSIFVLLSFAMLTACQSASSGAQKAVSAGVLSEEYERSSAAVRGKYDGKEIMERTITTQQRLNRYFHADVLPKLKNCWSLVQGRGTIEIEHTYTKGASGKWIVDKLTVGKSTLPRGQDAVALRCMQDSVRGTSFPAQSDESNAPTYVVNWAWPPFPANAATLASAMFAARSKGGSGGGCDGLGTPAKCFVCASARACDKVCVGYKECTLTYEQNGRGCTQKDACASGGPFGLAGGGVIIY